VKAPSVAPAICHSSLEFELLWPYSVTIRVVY
jgi:hypothetical protein